MRGIRRCPRYDVTERGHRRRWVTVECVGAGYRGVEAQKEVVEQAVVGVVVRRRQRDVGTVFLVHPAVTADEHGITHGIVGNKAQTATSAVVGV